MWKMCPKPAFCGEIRLFVAKFRHFCGEIAKIKQKETRTIRVSVVNYGVNLHSTHALRSTARFSLALAGALFKFHLTEAEGHANRYATGVVLIV